MVHPSDLSIPLAPYVHEMPSKAIELALSRYLPIDMGKKKGFITFPMVSARNECNEFNWDSNSPIPRASIHYSTVSSETY